MATPIGWPFAPNWSNGISERLTWATAIQTSRTGAEQREALRVGPRRQIDFPIILTDVERSYFEVLMARNGGSAWYVPIPHEEISVGSVPAGTFVFPCDPSFREIAVGNWLLVRGADGLHSELVELLDIATDHLTTSPTVNDYTAASITPTFLGVIGEKVDIARRTGRVYSGTVRFTSLEPVIWPSVGRDMAIFTTTFEGAGSLYPYPVLTDAPNAINDLQYTFERMWSIIDNNQSNQSYFDKAARQIASQQYEWFLYGRKEQQDFRDKLFLLQGKRNPIWVPTFNDDLPVGYGYPDPLKFSDLVAPPGREYFAQFFINGAVNCFPSSAYLDGDGIPQPIFDSALVIRNSFMSLKRMDSDEVEFTHHADASGVATVSMTFRDAPDLRVPYPYAPVGFSNSGYVDPVTHVRTAATNVSTGMTDAVTITGVAGGA